VDKWFEMTNRSHQKAFSLLLISRDRLLTPFETSFLEGHLRTCDPCKAQAQVHQVLQQSLGFESQSLALQKHEFQTKLPEFLNIIDRKRVVQKTTKIVLTATKLGVAVVLIVSLLWALNLNFPELLPTISTQKTLSPPTSTKTPQLVSSSASPMHKVTPTENVSKQRAEVIPYTVQQSDTIFRIAEKFQLKPETILWSNFEPHSYDQIILQPGMKLNILPVDGVYYEWKDGDDLNEVASQMGVQPEDIIDWPGNHLNLEALGDLSRPHIEPGTMLVIPGGHIDFVDWNAPTDP
jgi:LysM repeat protein